MKSMGTYTRELGKYFTCSKHGFVNDKDKKLGDGKQGAVETRHTSKRSGGAALSPRSSCSFGCGTFGWERVGRGLWFWDLELNEGQRQRLQSLRGA